MSVDNVTVECLYLFPGGLCTREFPVRVGALLFPWGFGRVVCSVGLSLVVSIAVSTCRQRR